MQTDQATSLGDLIECLHMHFLAEFHGDHDAAALATEAIILELLLPDPPDTPDEKAMRAGPILAAA